MKYLLPFLFAAHSALAVTGVTPFLDCVSYDQGNNQLTVFFGYISSNSSPVTVPVGPDNFISPSPEGRGQTTVFNPGTNYDAWQTTFDVTQEASITWSLLGQPVTASNDPSFYCSSCVCPPGGVGATGPQGPPGNPGPALAAIQAVTIVSTTSTATATCPSGLTLISGGGACTTEWINGELQSSAASGSNWVVTCYLGQATAVALCAGPNSP